MDLRLEITDIAETEATAFLAALAPITPDTRPITPDGDQTRDAALLIGIAGLVMSFPGAALAALQLRDHLDRRRMRDTLEALKAKLEEAGGEAKMQLPSGATLDIARTGTDAAVDLLLGELGHGR